MEPSDETYLIGTLEEAQELKVAAASVFQPRTPITTRELFAGRWNQMTTLADAVWQDGLHVVIYGERGVGKTSLANVVKPLIYVLDQRKDPGCSERLVIKANATSGDTLSSIWLKIFREITWEDNRPTVGLMPGRRRTTILEAFDLEGELTVDDVRRVMANMPGGLFIIDEFDRAPMETSREFTDLGCVKFFV